MATIHFCERKGCSSLVKSGAVGLLDFMPNPDAERKGWELCPPCTREVHELLTSPPVSERERAYDEPFDPEKRETVDAVEGATAEQLAAALFEKLLKSGQYGKRELSGTAHEASSERRTMIDHDYTD